MLKLDFREYVNATLAQKEKEYVKTVSVCLNPQNNGGEAVVLRVNFYHDGDKAYNNIVLEQHCYGNEAAMSFSSVSLDAFLEAVTYILYGGFSKDVKPEEKV